jgi:hypothetical protein
LRRMVSSYGPVNTSSSFLSPELSSTVKLFFHLFSSPPQSLTLIQP